MSLFKVPSCGAPEVRTFAEMAEKIHENRAITANGAGAGEIGEAMIALMDGGRFTPLTTKAEGYLDQAGIAAFTTPLSIPSPSDEGATGVVVDSSAVYAGRGLALKPIMAILRASRGAIYGPAFGKALPRLISAALSAALDKQIMIGNGAGNNGLGVFVTSPEGIPDTQNVNAAASGAPKLADILGIVADILALGANPATSAVAINPALLKNLLVETTSGYEGIRNELCASGKIMGVPVIGSSYAPSATTAGSPLAVGGDFRHIALASFPSFILDPIQAAEVDGIAYQATLYARVWPIVGTSFKRLIAV